MLWCSDWPQSSKMVEVTLGPESLTPGWVTTWLFSDETYGTLTQNYVMNTQNSKTYKKYIQNNLLPY